MNKTCSKEIATVNTAISAKEKTVTKRKELSATRRITYCATLVAASLILKTLGNFLDFGIIKITLVYVPWILSAVLLGPLGGAVVGFGTDLLGTFLAGNTPIPLIALANTMFPAIIALCLMLPLKNMNLKLIIGTAVAVTVCTMGLNTLALSAVTGNPFFVQLSIRVLQPAVVTVNLIVVMTVLPLLKKLKLL